MDLQEKVKQIFSLRKNKQLNEAYKVANEIYNIEQENEWVQRALAWVLVDMIKANLGNSAEHLAVLNSLPVTSSDEFLAKQMKYLHPNALQIKKAKELEKTGDFNATLNIYRNLESLNEEDQESYGWTIYRAIKSKEPNNNNLSESKKLLNEYLKLKNTRPSLLHSLILRLAISYVKEGCNLNLLNFLKIWNIEYFRKEDFIAESKDGNKYPSLATRVLTLLVKAVSNNSIDKDGINWIVRLFENIMPKIENDVYITRGYAILLGKAGRNDEASEIYKNVILKLSDNAWAWHEFANLIKCNDADLAISMLCKAMTIQSKEDFLGEIHLDLAELLAQKGLVQEANIELISYKHHRDDKGWKISERYDELTSKIALNQAKNTNANNKAFYESNKLIAEEYIISTIEPTVCLLLDIFSTKEGKEKITFSNLKDINFQATKKKFEILKEAKKNEIFNVWLIYDEEKIKYIPQKIEKSNIWYDDFINNVPSAVAAVNNVNEEQQLFHYIVNEKFHDNYFFNQTGLRFNIGDLIQIKYYSYKNRKYILDVKHYNGKSDLLKSIKGEIRLKYKADGKTYDWNEASERNMDLEKPDFAFIQKGYIVPKLLAEHNIYKDCEAEVYFVRSINKEKYDWKAYKIDLLSNKV